MKRAALIMLVASICVGVLALSGSAGASTVPVPDFPIPGSTDFYLKECSKLPEARKRTCYIRKLLAEVEKTNDPARTLPRIDDGRPPKRRVPRVQLSHLHACGWAELGSAGTA